MQNVIVENNYMAGNYYLDKVSAAAARSKRKELLSNKKVEEEMLWNHLYQVILFYLWPFIMDFWLFNLILFFWKENEINLFLLRFIVNFFCLYIYLIFYLICNLTTICSTQYTPQSVGSCASTDHNLSKGVFVIPLNFTNQFNCVI